jgi:DNA-binding response OmpR family regulator
MSASSARTGRLAAEKHRVLIADDDPVTRLVLSQYLAEAGYETVASEDGREALQQMDGEISVGLLDLEMPHISGLDCLRQVRKQHPHISVIMISGKGSLQDAVTAMKEGAFDYITKPFDRDELMVRVHQGCRASQLGRDNEALREAVKPAAPSFEFVACSPIAQQLVRQIAKVASLDSTVMLTGESGTGKTTVARMIHQSGPRADKPFVAVNCASLPRDLVEAELFGHTKGAFTGAVHDRPGRAEIADGGTLFLDEIGDLPLELQPKLLTFLQDRTFQRIGSNKIYTADVRMIAATHQDLAGMCRERAVSRGPVFPAERHRNPRARPPRPLGRHPGTDASRSSNGSGGGAASLPWRALQPRLLCCSSMPGTVMCVNWRMSWNAPQPSAKDPPSARPIWPSQPQPRTLSVDRWYRIRPCWPALPWTNWRNKPFKIRCRLPAETRPQPHESWGSVRKASTTR